MWEKVVRLARVLLSITYIMEKAVLKCLLCYVMLCYELATRHMEMEQGSP